MSKYRRLRIVLATVAALGALGLAGAAVVIQGGFYDVAAMTPHFQLVHTLLEKAMVASVRHHARDVRVPAAVLAAFHAAAAGTDVPGASNSGDNDNDGSGYNADNKGSGGASPSKRSNDQALLRGAGLYRDNCLVCHGAPGVAQGDIGKSMQPVPGPLADAARRWRPGELYWIIRHGIKMSGMPAWEYHLADDDIWALVGFLGELPGLSSSAHAALTARAGPRPRALRPSPAAPDPERGRLALTQYACQACHRIDGVTGPDTWVGPPLKGLAARKYIAGHLPNNAANLALWICDPHRIDPLTAMPAMGVTESDARDMAAYLLTR